MALTFRTVTRKVLAGTEAGKTKTYAMALSKGLMPLSEVCELVSSRSSFSPSDVRGILEGMAWAVSFLLRSGHAVQLGDLGCFRTSISTDGVEETDNVKFDATLIRQARILFTPGTMLRETMRNMEFVPVTPVVIEVPIPCDKEHVA